MVYVRNNCDVTKVVTLHRIFGKSDAFDSVRQL